MKMEKSLHNVLFPFLENLQRYGKRKDGKVFTQCTFSFSGKSSKIR